MFNINIRGKGLDWFLNIYHVLGIAGAIIFGLILQQISIMLGWQPIPASIAANIQVMALIIVFGTMGYALGKVGK